MGASFFPTRTQFCPTIRKGIPEHLAASSPANTAACDVHKKNYDAGAF